MQSTQKINDLFANLNIIERCVLVVGAGPIGLLAALLLEKKGVRNIVVVDPRAGAYIRSNDFTADVFECFAEMLGIEIIPSKGQHIKDLEKILYGHAQQKANIRIIKSKFVRLDGKKAVIKDKDEKTEEILCDIIFDCSGTHRCIIEAVNQSQPSNPPFGIAPIREIKPQHFIFARGRMRTDEVPQLNDLCDFSPNIQKELKKVGWEEDFIPLAYANILERDQDLLLAQRKKTLIKVNIYAQAPKNLKEESEQKAWLEAVLQIKIGKHNFEFLKPSVKSPDKKTISCIPVAPDTLTPGYYFAPSKPAIFVLGDALAQIPFILGFGTILNATKVNELVNSFRVVMDGRIQFDTAAIETLYIRFAIDHSTSVRDSIRLQNKGKFLLEEKSNLKLSSIEDYIKAKKEMSAINDPGQKKESMLHVAVNAKSVGASYFEAKSYVSAITFFKFSLEIYLEYLPEADIDISKLYSNLIICHKKCNEEDRALLYARHILAKLAPAIRRVTDPIYIKIIFNKVDILLGRAEKLLEKDDLEEVNNCLKEISKDIDFLDPANEFALQLTSRRNQLQEKISGEKTCQPKSRLKK